MSAKSEFIKTWRRWRHTDFPNHSFRLRRSNARTYNAELILDHLHSYIYALGSSVMAGDMANLQSAVSKYEAELREAEKELEGYAFTDSEESPYALYISATRDLLICIANMEESE